MSGYNIFEPFGEFFMLYSTQKMRHQSGFAKDDISAPASNENIEILAPHKLQINMSHSVKFPHPACLHSLSPTIFHPETGKKYGRFLNNTVN